MTTESPVLTAKMPEVALVVGVVMVCSTVVVPASVMAMELTVPPVMERAPGPVTVYVKGEPVSVTALVAAGVGVVVYGLQTV